MRPPKSGGGVTPQMQILHQLYERLREPARQTAVKTVSIGLGYTAVATDEGGLGLACTMLEAGRHCHPERDFPDFEGKRADRMLPCLLSDEPLGRALGLALANALNFGPANALPEDRHNAVLFDRLGIGPGSKVAMVGHFGPLIRKLSDMKASLEMVDRGRGEGDEADLLKKLSGWADALIMTSTTLINETAETILSAVGRKVKTAMVGPSTPLVAGAVEGLPVHLLGGMVPIDFAATLAAVRHGRGTPALQKFAKKTFLDLTAG